MKDAPLHDLPENNANHDLALSVKAANRLHRKIQLRILELNRKSIPVASAFDEHLAPLYRLLSVLESAAWRAVSTRTIDAELHADFVALDLERQHANVTTITSDAAKVSTA